MKAMRPLGKGPPRILCISPLFPPTADAEAFCTAKLILALKAAGCEVEVLYSSNFCPGARKDDSLMWRSLSTCSHDVPVPAAGGFIDALGCVMRYGTLLLPRWVRAIAERAEELDRDKRFDVVYSRSLPMIAHVAGYHVSRQLRLPWVANLNDPWDFHLFPGAGLRDRLRPDRLLSGSWLRRTQKNANLVTYCSSWLRDFHIKITGLEHSSAVLPHIGWRIPPGERKRPAGTLHLVHAGKLGANEFTGRSAATLLEGVRNFTLKHTDEKLDFLLTLVGPQDPETERLILQLGLKQFVQTVGPVSYEQSLRWISSATVCVLVEAELNTGIFFASKCADYLAAGKPILAFSPSRGVVADLAARGRGITRIEGRNSAAVTEALEAFYRAQRYGRLEELAPADELRATCSAEDVAAEFLGMLRGLGIAGTLSAGEADRMDSTARSAAALPQTARPARWG